MGSFHKSGAALSTLKTLRTSIHSHFNGLIFEALIALNNHHIQSVHRASRLGMARPCRVPILNLEPYQIPISIKVRMVHVYLPMETSSSNLCSNLCIWLVPLYNSRQATSWQRPTELSCTQGQKSSGQVSTQ